MWKGLYLFQENSVFSSTVRLLPRGAGDYWRWCRTCLQDPVFMDSLVAAGLDMTTLEAATRPLRNTGPFCYIIHLSVSPKAELPKYCPSHSVTYSSKSH